MLKIEQQGIKNARSLLGKLLKGRQSITLPDGNMLAPPPLDLPGRKICVLGDTSDASGGILEPGKGLASLALGCDVLVHECTNAALPAVLVMPNASSTRNVPTEAEVLEKATG